MYLSVRNLCVCVLVIIGEPNVDLFLIQVLLINLIFYCSNSRVLLLVFVLSSFYRLSFMWYFDCQVFSIALCHLSLLTEGAWSVEMVFTMDS
jgi:hypothetical protein